MSESGGLREAAWLEFTRSTPEAFWDVEVWRHEGWLSGVLDVASRKRIVLAVLALPQVADLRGIVERVEALADEWADDPNSDLTQRACAALLADALASSPTTHESEEA